MKKDILIPVLLIFLGLIFIFINIMVFFSKNRWFISRKLKVGALIISLTSILACGVPGNQESAYSIENNHVDSIAKQKKQDSIKEKTDSISIANKKDSINKANQLKHKKDSIFKIKTKKKALIVPTCYDPVPDKR
jgi:hypothetical protein